VDVAPLPSGIRRVAPAEHRPAVRLAEPTVPAEFDRAHAAPRCRALRRALIAGQHDDRTFSRCADRRGCTRPRDADACPNSAVDRHDELRTGNRFGPHARRFGSGHRWTDLRSFRKRHRALRVWTGSPAGLPADAGQAVLLHRLHVLRSQRGSWRRLRDDASRSCRTRDIERAIRGE
jgi:hypothetical protein